MMSIETSESAAFRLRPWLSVACAVAVLSVLIDCVPRFHLGDSESYLATRLDGWIPDDRSWLYGLGVNLVLWATRDLAAIPLLGILVSAAAGVGLAAFLCARYGLASWKALLFCMIYTLNPLEFFWSRSLMADSAANAVFVACIVLPFLRLRGLFALPLLFAVSALLVALRVVFFPALFGALVVAAMVGLAAAGFRWRAANFEVRRCALGALVVLLGYVAFTAVNTRVVGAPWFSANHASARFLLGAWSPALSGRIDSLSLPLQDEADLLPLTRDNRLAQTFAENGVVESLRRHAGSYFAAEPLYRGVLASAVREAPLAVAGVILRSWIDYMNPSQVVLYHREARFSGATGYKQPDTLSAGTIDQLRSIGLWQEISPAFPQISSRALTWFKLGGGWWSVSLAVFATAAVLLSLLFGMWRDPLQLVLMLFAFFYVGLVAATSNELVTRYLLPLSVPLLSALAWIMRRRVPA